MSAVFTPNNGNIVQVGVFTDGDTYTHVRAGTISNPGISCDSEADLPAQSGGISGYFLEQGSTAHAIQENTIHCITSGGAWIRQDEASRMDIYTKQQIDQMLALYTPTATQQLIDAAQDQEIDSLEASSDILLSDISPIRIGSGTTSFSFPIDLAPGEYYIHFGTIESTDTDYTTCQVIALNGTSLVSASPQLQSQRGANVTGLMKVNSTADAIEIYASRTGTASSGDVVSFTGLTIAKK